MYPSFLQIFKFNINSFSTLIQQEVCHEDQIYELTAVLYVEKVMLHKIGFTNLTMNLHELQI